MKRGWGILCQASLEKTRGRGLSFLQKQTWKWKVHTHLQTSPQQANEQDQDKGASPWGINTDPPTGQTHLKAAVSSIDFLKIFRTTNGEQQSSWYFMNPGYLTPLSNPMLRTNFSSGVGTQGAISLPWSVGYCGGWFGSRTLSSRSWGLCLHSGCLWRKAC